MKSMHTWQYGKGQWVGNIWQNSLYSKDSICCLIEGLKHQIINSFNQYFTNCMETSDENLYVDIRAWGPQRLYCRFSAMDKDINLCFCQSCLCLIFRLFLTWLSKINEKCRLNHRYFENARLPFSVGPQHFSVILIGQLCS